MTRARMLLCLAFFLPLSVAPVVRADDPPNIPDQTTGHVQWNPKGSPPVQTVNVGATTYQDGRAGWIDFNHGGGTSGNGGSSSGTGGTGSGPVVPVCFDSGVILDEQVPIPGLSIQTDPPVQKAVVGVPTWFWTEPSSVEVPKPQAIQGHYYHCDRWTDADGNPHADLIRVGVTVTVTVWAAQYLWNWGDGTFAADTCGAPDEPTACSGSALGRKDQSDLSKIYQDSSAGHPDGYNVTLSVGFQARFGGPGAPVIGPFWQGTELDLPVREVQSVLVQP